MSSTTSENGAECPEVPIILKVKTLDRGQFQISLLSTASVPQLKEKVETATGIVQGQQRLIFRGKVLQNDQKLSEYAIEDGHTLHLVVRPISNSSTDTVNTSQTPGTEGARRSASDELQSGRVIMGATISVPEGSNIDALGSLLTNIISSVHGVVDNTSNASGSSTATTTTTSTGNRTSTPIPTGSEDFRRSTISRTGGRVSMQQLLRSVGPILRQIRQSNNLVETIPTSELDDDLKDLKTHLDQLCEYFQRSSQVIGSLPSAIQYARRNPGPSVTRNYIRLLSTLGGICRAICNNSFQRINLRRVSSPGQSGSTRSRSHRLNVDTPISVERVINVPLTSSFSAPQFVSVNHTPFQHPNSNSSNNSSASNAVPDVFQEIFSSIMGLPRGSERQTTRTGSTSTRNSSENPSLSMNLVDLANLLVKSIPLSALFSFCSGDFGNLKNIWTCIYGALEVSVTVPSLNSSNVREWSKAVVFAIREAFKKSAFPTSVSDLVRDGKDLGDELCKVLDSMLVEFLEHLLSSDLSTDEFNTATKRHLLGITQQLLASMHMSLKDRNSDLFPILKSLMIHYGSDEHLSYFFATKIASCSLVCESEHRISGRGTTRGRDSEASSSGQHKRPRN